MWCDDFHFGSFIFRHPFFCSRRLSFRNIFILIAALRQRSSMDSLLPPENKLFSSLCLSWSDKVYRSHLFQFLSFLVCVFFFLSFFCGVSHQKQNSFRFHRIETRKHFSRRRQSAFFHFGVIDGRWKRRSQRRGSTKAKERKKKRKDILLCLIHFSVLWELLIIWFYCVRFVPWVQAINTATWKYKQTATIFFCPKQEKRKNNGDY